MGPLGERLADHKAPGEGRLNALWALTRIDGASAQDGSVGVHGRGLDLSLAAIYSAGLHKDKDALADLINLTKNPNLAVRRQVATALGRLSKSEAVPALLEALRDDREDRWLEHALIYALIQIDAPAATRRGLTDSSSTVQRGALIALDQMANGNLTREEAIPLLSSADPAAAGGGPHCQGASLLGQANGRPPA